MSYAVTIDCGITRKKWAPSCVVVVKHRTNKTGGRAAEKEKTGWVNSAGMVSQLKACDDEREVKGFCTYPPSCERTSADGNIQPPGLSTLAVFASSRVLVLYHDF